MHSELDRALDENPDYPPGFDPRWLSEGEEEKENQDELRTVNVEVRSE